jgi:hypothetical protein
MDDTDTSGSAESRSSWLTVAIAWALVGVPLAWGIYKTLEKALVLFR